MVQWQNTTFPRLRRGFDSPHSLIIKKPPGAYALRAGYFADCAGLAASDAASPAGRQIVDKPFNVLACTVGLVLATAAATSGATFAISAMSTLSVYV